MHIPVLLNEVLSFLKPSKGEVYVDATFGLGGYCRAILESCNCSIIAIDRDENAVNLAREFKNKYGERFEFYNTNFSNITDVLAGRKVNGIVADFGVSSVQLDTAERGFSFLKDAKLDMRMSRLLNGDKTSAFEVVNQFSEEKLANIILKFGEEKLAKKIASSIIRARVKNAITTTTELAKIIEEAYGSSIKYTKIHPATKTFQAIRIFINDELVEIETLLLKSKDLLVKGGRIICVSFHSLEDSIVKDFFNHNSASKEKINKYKSFSKIEKGLSEERYFNVITKSPITPSKQEISQNIRSRSAKLRCAIRI